MEINNLLRFSQFIQSDGYYEEIKQQMIRRTQMGERTLIFYWWEFKIVQPQCKSEWRLLKTLKIKLLSDPTIPLLSINRGKNLN